MLFGKLPAVGDFVSRGLSADALATWDGWATVELSTAREVLGEGFEASHDVAPPLAFHVVDQALTGVVAPSVDKVGRRFLAMLGIQDADPETVERDAALADEALTWAILNDTVPDDVAAQLEARRAGPAEPVDAVSPILCPVLPVGFFSDHLIAVGAGLET